MNLPKTGDLEVAVVSILSKYPDGLSVGEILDEVILYFKLEPTCRYLLGNNGRPELSYRLGWARTHAKNRGLIERSQFGKWKTRNH